MVRAQVKIEHINHITAKKAVDDIPYDTRVKKRLRHC